MSGAGGNGAKRKQQANVRGSMRGTTSRVIGGCGNSDAYADISELGREPQLSAGSPRPCLTVNALHPSPRRPTCRRGCVAELDLETQIIFIPVVKDRPHCAAILGMRYL